MRTFGTLLVVGIFALVTACGGGSDGGELGRLDDQPGVTRCLISKCNHKEIIFNLPIERMVRQGWRA